MGDKTGIEWCDATWNPTTGCNKVSPGCDHCYALTMAARLKGMGQENYQTDGDPKTSGPGFGFAMHPRMLDQPIRWTKPRVIFVNSMSDLFHSEMDRDFLARVWAVMAATPRHTYQVLTKRPQIARSWLSDPAFRDAVNRHYWMLDLPDATDDQLWPLDNIWIGTSVEDQKRADLRIPALLGTPAAHRFLSMEPLLGSTSIVKWIDPERDCNCMVPALDGAGQHANGCACLDQPEIEWVIAGGESGADARPMHPDWARAVRDECARAGVAFHLKQWGEWAPHRLDGGEHVNVRLSKTRDQYRSLRFATDGTLYKASEPDLYSYPGMVSMLRVGKRKAGRTLDGRTHDDVPGRTDVVTT